METACFDAKVAKVASNFLVLFIHLHTRKMPFNAFVFTFYVFTYEQGFGFSYFFQTSKLVSLYDSFLAQLTRAIINFGI